MRAISVSLVFRACNRHALAWPITASLPCSGLDFISPGSRVRTGDPGARYRHTQGQCLQRGRWPARRLLQSVVRSWWNLLFGARALWHWCFSYGPGWERPIITLMFSSLGALQALTSIPLESPVFADPGFYRAKCPCARRWRFRGIRPKSYLLPTADSMAFQMHPAVASTRTIPVLAMAVIPDTIASVRMLSSRLSMFVSPVGELRGRLAKARPASSLCKGFGCQAPEKEPRTRSISPGARLHDLNQTPQGVGAAPGST